MYPAKHEKKGDFMKKVLVLVMMMAVSLSASAGRRATIQGNSEIGSVGNANLGSKYCNVFLNERSQIAGTRFKGSQHSSEEGRLEKRVNALADKLQSKGYHIVDFIEEAGVSANISSIGCNEGSEVGCDRATSTIDLQDLSTNENFIAFGESVPFLFAGSASTEEAFSNAVDNIPACSK